MQGDIPRSHVVAACRFTLPLTAPAGIMPWHSTQAARDERPGAEGEDKGTRMAVTLFVSHAPADDAFAQALTQALVEAGVDARAETFGPDQPTPGNDRAIAVRECAIFLPVLSRAALSSPRARSEARRFHDTYHGASGRYLLPVLVEPLELEELWPFLQEYQRIEGPPGEQWSPDALIAGVLQWVTQVIPARARTPSGALRLSGSPAPRTGLPTRPLGVRARA